MADRFTLAQRSVLMSGIKSKNTRFELDFIASLKKATRRKFETFARDVIGTPDIVFRKDRVCIFLDSDFWHGWHYPQWKDKMKNDFWRNKIEKNRLRDRKTTRTLRNKGWIVLRVWEHNIKKEPEKVVAAIVMRLKT